MGDTPTSTSSRWQDIQRRAAELMRREAERDDATSHAMAELLHQVEIYQTELQAQNQSLRHVEAELAAMSTRYGALYDFAPVGLLSLDDEDAVVTANATTSAILGQPRDALLGVPLSQWLLPASADALHRHLRCSHRSSSPAAVPLELDPQRTGIEATRWIELRAVVRPPHASAAEHVWCSVSDVTEQRASADAVERASRLEAVSTLAAGVAHDFNNLLVPIELNLTHVLDRLEPEDEARRDALHEAHVATRQASELARHMMTFAREGPYQPTRVDLAEVVESTVRDADDRIAERAAVRVDTPPTPVFILGDRAQLQQALLNLLANATEALEAAGVVEVGLAVVDGQVSLTVSDTGRGMSAATASRACDPFFTTKPQGRGLGLTAVSAVVRQHGGAVGFDSVQGDGTRVTITLPLVPEDVSVASDKSVVVAEEATVLVVDDDDLVRRATARTLRPAGYEVLPASDGREALALLAEHPVDIVLLDMVMPGMSGPEVFDDLRARRPDLPVVIVTGQYDTEAVRQLLTRGARRVVNKPFRGPTLLEAIGGALRGA